MDLDKKPMEDMPVADTESAAGEPSADTAPAQEAAAEETATSAEKNEEAPAFTLTATDAPVKKKKKKKLGLIITISVIAAVLITACILGWSFIVSFFNRTFLSPAEYMQKMERKEVASFAETLADSYEQFLADYKKDMGKNATEVDAKIKLGDTALSLIKPHTPAEFLDCSWLSDTTLQLKTVEGEDGTQVTIAAGLKDAQILTLELSLDESRNVLYVKIAELNDTPLRIRMDESSIILYEALLGDSDTGKKVTDAVVKCLPDRDTFRDMIVEYTELFIAELDKVEKEQTRIAVGEESRAVTALTATITEEDACDMLVAMLTKAKSDPRIANFLNALTVELKASCPELEIENLYDEFVKSADDTIEELKKEKETANDAVYLRYTMYVDYMDNIIGRRLVQVDKGIETELFHYHIAAKSRKNLAYEVSLDVTEDFRHPETLVLTGRYQQKKDTVTVTCSGTKNGKAYLTANFESSGEKTGTLRLQPSKMLMEELETDLPAVLLDGNLAISVDFDTAQDVENYTIRVLLGDEVFADVKLNVEKSKAELEMPTTGVNPENDLAFGLWAISIDFEAYFQKLEDAGVPKVLVNRLRRELVNFVAGEMGGIM